MADPYIDPHETWFFGKFAREQMEAVCLGVVKACDGAVRFCVQQQQQADDGMADALALMPVPVSAKGTQEAIAKARDVIIRFGRYLESIKGRPVDPSVFFRREAPSTVARRRLVKLVAAVDHIRTELPKHQGKLKSAKDWIAEIEEVHDELDAAERTRRDVRVGMADLRPEVVAARERWLAVYGANKALVGGVLRHAGKAALMPLVFDDLAETHRVAGVSDDMPLEGEGEGDAATPAAPPPAVVEDPV